MNMISRLMVASALTAAAAIASPVSAQTMYNNSASFAGATSSLTTETFDSFQGSNYKYSPITTSGFTVSQAGGNLLAYDADNGSGGSLSFTTAATPVTFTFNSAITAFGATFYDLGTLGSTTLTATYAGGVATLASNFTGTSGNSFFAGFTSATPFTTLTLSNTRIGDFIEIDNVQFGAATIAAPAPEPATWGMMILGFGVVGTAMRRRRMISTRVSYAA